MRKVILAGATSFIGMNLISELYGRGYDITALIRPNSKNKHKIECFGNIKIVEIEMSEYKHLNEYIDYIRGSIIINLAWEGTRGSERDDHFMQKKNYEDALSAIKNFVDNGCEMIINAGSQAEYGFHEGIIFEDTECRPVTEYGKYKLKLYNESYDYCKKNNIKFVEARFFSLYGPGDSENTMIISILNSMIKNKACKLTECTQIWNFLHIRDAVRGIRTLIENECESGAYNFGSLDTRELKSFIEEMYYLSNSKSKMFYGSIDYTNGVLHLAPNITKLMNTGWKPEIKFEDGIVEMIDIARRGEISEKN